MSVRATSLSRLPNIGLATEHWLRDIGVESEHDLRALGAVEAYRRINLVGHPTSRNLLYALYGALHDLPWNRLPPDIKEQLQREAGLSVRNTPRSQQSQEV